MFVVCEGVGPYPILALPESQEAGHTGSGDKGGCLHSRGKGRNFGEDNGDRRNKCHARRVELRADGGR